MLGAVAIYELQCDGKDAALSNSCKVHRALTEIVARWS